MNSTNTYAKQVIYQLLSSIVRKQKDNSNGGGGAGKKKGLFIDSDEEDPEDLTNDTTNLISEQMKEDLI